MHSWRDKILEDFPAGICRLTIVSDPDGLFDEILLAQELNRRGFEITKFGDSIEFRYEYEKDFRAAWDSGKALDLIVVTEEKDTEIIQLPYDLLKKGRILSYGLADIFPTLSYPILKNLDIHLIDALYAKKHLLSSELLGDNATIDTILKLVYGLQPEFIDTDEELLGELLRIHYSRIGIDELSAKRLISALKEKPYLKNWPVEKLVKDSKAFYDFLQERWPLYLNHKQKDEIFDSNNVKQPFRIPGPAILPFGGNRIRPFIDNLFVEGILKPVATDTPEKFLNSWEQCGIIVHPEIRKQARIAQLCKLVEAHIPSEESDYRQWQDFSLLWAELSMLVEIEGNAEDLQALYEMRKFIDDRFSEWLSQSFKLLINLSPVEPVMVHHVHRMLERHFEEYPNCNLALIVIDGLSLSQWLNIRHYFESNKAPLKFRETAIFSWVPTLTSISRQAIFSGKIPINFGKYIASTSQEEALWKQSWEEKTQIMRGALYYQKAIEKSNPQEILHSLDSLRTPIVAGLVINIIDEIMHGNLLGSGGMHNMIKLWLEQGFLEMLLDELTKRGYLVWITSDHGNIECEGKGRLSGEGILAIGRGERARMYTSENLRDVAAKKSPFGCKWKPIGLPEGYYPLLATGNSAFISEREKAVSHGGISIDEVIVPLIRVERN